MSIEDQLALNYFISTAEYDSYRRGSLHASIGTFKDEESCQAYDRGHQDFKALCMATEAKEREEAREYEQEQINDHKGVSFDSGMYDDDDFIRYEV